jgi:hypothetical protein
MIVSFKDADSEALARGARVGRFAAIEASARRKLRQMEIEDYRQEERGCRDSSL